MVIKLLYQPLLIGPGTQERIAIDELDCSGHEGSVFDCNHNNYFEHDCTHNDDIGVSCGIDTELSKSKIYSDEKGKANQIGN